MHKTPTKTQTTSLASQQRTKQDKPSAVTPGAYRPRHGPVPTAFLYSRSPNYGAQRHPEPVWELLGSPDYLLRGRRNSVPQE